MHLNEPHLEQPNVIALKELADEVIEILGTQPNVISLETAAKTLVIGDLHGDLKATKHVFKMCQQLNCERMIFLGDYVDRGPNPLAVLEYTLKMSLANPEFIVILRGNHEDETMNSMYGFHAELRSMFPYQAGYEQAIKHSLTIYDCMPLAAQTPDSFFLHGGIPQATTLDDIKSIPKPHSRLTVLENSKSQKMQRIFEEIRWNDPDETLSSGYSPSPRGSPAKCFSCLEAENFLRKTVERRRLFRSHECSRGAFESLWDGLVVHILTSDPDLAESVVPSNRIGTVAIENENGSVDVLNLEGSRIASLPPKRWTGRSVCK